MDQSLLPVKSEGPALDVLVVGSGPVGLLAAAELASRGCKVRLVDVNESPVLLTKASGVHERSMEILPQPVSDSIMKTSKHVAQARMFEHDGNGVAKLLGVAGMNSDMRGAKGMRSQMQWLTEKALTDHLASLPDALRPGSMMQVERPLELASFKEVADGVECELKNVKTGSSEVVTSKLLLGCDGGKSTIRKGLGFTFEGEVTPEYFFALHATFTGYVGEPNSVDFFFSKGKDPHAPGMCFVMPMPDGGYLVLVDLDLGQQKEWVTGEKDRNGLPVLRQPSPEEVVEVMKERGCGRDMALVPGSVQWVAHFRVNSRQTNRYGKGRIYLAGDACHCHSPLGGQGMNMGFNDAKNIAWKLAYVAKGAMPERILSTYERERQPIEHKILLAIERGQKTVSNRNPVFFFMRGRGQRAILTVVNFAVEQSDGGIMRYATQQAWTYATSPLSVEHWERPRPGCPIPFPGLLARKSQNILRWLSNRVRAGDTVPDAPVVGGSLHAVLKRSRGWTLILFEGSPTCNETQRTYVPRSRLFTKEELQDMGESLKAVPDSTGFVAGIDEVVVVPSGAEAQFVFGVQGQCLYLVRPDLHVGLRSEPLRKEVVLQYFEKQCGMSVPAYKTPPASSGYSDPLPLTVYGTAIVVSLTSGALTGFRHTWLNVLIAFFVCLFLFLFRVSRPPKDSFQGSGSG